MKAELLIWNLDGAVMDARQGVEPAVRRAVQGYFGSLLGVHGSGSLVTEEEAWQVQAAGGLDEPWTLAMALVRLLLDGLPGSFRKSRPAHSVGEGVAFLRSASRAMTPIAIPDLRERADLMGATERLRAAGGGLEGVGGIVRGGWAHPLLVADEETNLVRQLFMETFLGRKGFARVERGQPELYRGPGLVEAETLRLPQATMDRLRAAWRGRMGLVSLWSREATALRLGRLNAAAQWDATVAQEDVAGEEARLRRQGGAQSLAKPHPFMLLEAAATLDPAGGRAACFLGATPDDMRMARAADAAGRRIVAWAIAPNGSHDDSLAGELLAAGAERVFDNADELEAALLG